jgi:hypothetical protein
MYFRKLDFRRGHYGLPEIATEVGGGAELVVRGVHPTMLKKRKVWPLVV